MKVGLSNHQPICVCVFECPPLITFETIDRFSWNLVECDIIEGDLDPTRFNLVALAIPK
jgi:hypothetical protein